MYGALRKSWSMATRSRKLRAQPVEFPDNERVTVLQCLEATEQSRALFLPCFKSCHFWNVSESRAGPYQRGKIPRRAKPFALFKRARFYVAGFAVNTPVRLVE